MGGDGFVARSLCVGFFQFVIVYSIWQIHPLSSLSTLLLNKNFQNSTRYLPHNRANCKKPASRLGCIARWRHPAKPMPARGHYDFDRWMHMRKPVPTVAPAHRNRATKLEYIGNGTPPHLPFLALMRHRRGQCFVDIRLRFRHPILLTTTLVIERPNHHPQVDEPKRSDLRFRRVDIDTTSPVVFQKQSRLSTR